jgi:hypothetical protein
VQAVQKTAAQAVRAGSALIEEIARTLPARRPVVIPDPRMAENPVAILHLKVAAGPAAMVHSPAATADSLVVMESNRAVRNPVVRMAENSVEKEPGPDRAHTEDKDADWERLQRHNADKNEETPGP